MGDEEVQYVLGDPQDKHVGVIQCLLVDDSGVYTGGRDGRVAGHTPGCGPPLWSTQPHSHWVTGLVSLGPRLVSSSLDSSIKVLDSSTGQVSARIINAHDDYIEGLVGHVSEVVSVSLDKSAKHWDMETRACIRVYEGIDSLYCLARYSSSIVVGGASAALGVWDPRADQYTSLSSDSSHSIIRSVMVTNDWTCITGGNDKYIREYDLRYPGQELHRLEPGFTVWAMSQGYACGNSSKVLQLDKDQYTVVYDHDCKSIPCVAASTTGVYTSTSSGQVHHDEQVVLCTTPAVHSVKIHDDAMHVTSVDSKDQETVWNVVTGQSVPSALPLLPHAAPWFKVDTLTGSVRVTLSPAQCFAGNVFVSDQVPDFPWDLVPSQAWEHKKKILLNNFGEVRVNYGELLLRRLYLGATSPPPEWVSKCVQHHEYSTQDAKIKFELVPGPGLPELCKGRRFTAADTITTRRVAVFALNLLPLDESQEPVLARYKQAIKDQTPGLDTMPEEMLEIVYKDQVLDPHISLRSLGATDPLLRLEYRKGPVL